MPRPAALDTIGDEPFVSLATFRSSGEAVPTPVWVGRDGDTLLVTTPAGSGKVKRLRDDPRVRLQPCDRRGAVEPGAATVHGTAQVLDDEQSAARVKQVLRDKYGLQYKVITTLERVASRRRGRRRVVLRITLDPAAG